MFAKIVKSSDVTPELRAIPLFSSLKENVIAGLSEHAVRIHEKKGTILFLPDAPNDKFYVVRSGWVKIFRETIGGEEAIVDVLTTGHTFGEIGLSSTETMPYGACVIEDAELIVLPRFLLAEEVMRNSLFGLSVLQNLTRQKLQRDMEIEHRTVQTAPQRIGCFLLKFCGDNKKTDIVLHLPYDKTAIASRLGMQPETFSRALSRLKEETGIRVNGSRVEIDNLNRLVEYTCAACSSHFPCQDK